MKYITLFAILACCMTLTVQASDELTPAGFWSLVRGEYLVHDAHMTTSANTMTELRNILKKNRATIIMFYTTWCDPCKKIARYFEDETRRNGIAIVAVDTDKNTDARWRYRIESIPAFKVVNSNGDEKGSEVGGTEAKVQSVIRSAKRV